MFLETLPGDLPPRSRIASSLSRVKRSRVPLTTTAWPSSVCSFERSTWAASIEAGSLQPADQITSLIGFGGVNRLGDHLTQPSTAAMSSIDAAMMASIDRRRRRGSGH